jgi:hypothetical protein
MQFQAREHQLRIVEVPIKVIYAERAKRNPVSHGMQVLDGIMRIIGQTRPLLYFGLAGISLLVMGAALGLRIIDVYTRTHTLAIGYGLITVMLCVMGMLLFFAGVMLHSTREMMVELRRSLVERLGRREQI